MSSQKKAGEHGTHSQHQHSSHLHNPTGYTDEAAQEEHEFFDRVEHEAETGQPQSSSNQGSSNTSGSKQQGKKGGLESSMGQTGQKASSTMEDVKNKAKDTMGIGKTDQ